MELWFWIVENWWVPVAATGVATTASVALRAYWRGDVQRFTQSARGDGGSKIDQSISIE